MVLLDFINDIVNRKYKTYKSQRLQISFSKGDSVNRPKASRGQEVGSLTYESPYPLRS
jgi:hypothetical protein